MTVIPIPSSFTTSKYVQAAIDAELADLRRTSSGRACAAYRAAAAVGGFVAAGEIERSDAERLLLDAALATGLPAHEAIAHVRRGLDRGESTPRSVPDNRGSNHSRSSPPLRTGIGSAPAEDNLRRPPRAEVNALWADSLPVGSDPEVARWFRHRFCHHPREELSCLPTARSGDAKGFCYRHRPSWVVERIELWDLARAIPAGLDVPLWARSGSGPWSRTGHRALFRMWDACGQLVSLRARCIDPAVTPKSLAPSGFEARGLVFADPLAVQLLAGAMPEWWDPPEIIISEGEVDFVTWAIRQSEADPQGPAVIGVEAGAWSAAIAARIPDGSAVVVRTHHDAPGERYAQQIADTLRGRCHLYRSQREEQGR